MIPNFFKSAKPKSANQVVDWSIDRIKKVSDGHVQYARFSSPEYKPFTCVACLDPGRKENVLTCQGVKYFVCHRCGSHLIDPDFNLVINEGLTPDQLASKIYREIDANGPAHDAVLSLGDRPGGSFLALNAGLGFSVDAVQIFAPGRWSVVGFEPGPLAKHAASWLGCQIEKGDESSLEQSQVESFDVIYSAYGLARAKAPCAYIPDVMRWLKKGGRLVFSVPNASQIYTLNNNVHVKRLLEPGINRVLFTKNGLLSLFRNAGLSDPAFIEDEYSLKVIYPAEKVANTPDVTTSYIEMVVRRGQDELRFTRAASEKLFIGLMDRGDGAEISKIRSLYLPLFDELARAAADFSLRRSSKNIFESITPTTGRLLFSEAMYCLNFERDFARASAFFSLSSLYGRKASALSKSHFPDELELAGCADYHRVLSLLKLDDLDGAALAKSEILKHGVVEPWLSKIEEL